MTRLVIQQKVLRAVARCAALVAIAGIAVADPVRADQPITPSRLAAQFSACDLEVLESGLGRHGGDGATIVTARLLAEWRQQALISSPRLQDRDSFGLQLAAASSVQRAQVYGDLAGVMRQAFGRGNIGVPVADLRAVTARAADIAKARDGVALCADLKWANKRPDWALVPVPQADFDRIRALFAPERYHAQRPGLLALSRDTGLSTRTLFEMRAIRLALFYFELGQAALVFDRGDFVGNMTQQISRATVCTDEATIAAGFIQRGLIETGLVKTLTLRPDGQYAHRRPLSASRIAPLKQLLDGFNNRFGLTDHFAPILRDAATGRDFVLDSWVEDGGVPPHIAPLDRWHDRGEAENVVPLATHPSEAWIDALLDRKLTTPSGQIARAKRGTAQYRRLQDGLLARHFGAVRPVPRPDPRDARLRRAEGAWIFPEE